ncbi:linear gramicidin synthase subunit D [bacterium BMS3Abin10]|nr:linear gramicidin synthase subunit D [bacterium BMS3Abin10]GBE37519.1 linear gramicidin synthase subunit D [bacterium BMS3Bbin08]
MNEMHVYLLQHLLQDSANRYPDQEAVVYKESSITYADLNIKSDQLSQALIQLGVKTGDRVGLMLNKSIESVICIFGTLKSGATYVPIDPSAPVSRIKYIINNCEIQLLLTSGQGADKLIPDLDTNSALRKVLITEGDAQQLTEQCKNLEIIPWEGLLLNRRGRIKLNIADINPAYILHTSGSTGLPKGVVISHLNALIFINMASDFFRINATDRLCCHAPLHFDLSVFDIFAAIKSGATIIMIPEFLSMFPVKLAEYIDKNNISVWNSVSSVLASLAYRGGLENFQFESLHIVHFSGDIMPVKYLRILKKHIKNASFYNIYGQTEANSSMCYQIKDIPDDNAWKIPIGKPFPNFEVFAINGDNRIISSPGEEGELYVKSATVAIGYWRDEKMTDEKFITDPHDSSHNPKVYKTGDIVRIDNDGNYLFVGRKDRVVKSRGYRIELDEIEVTLNNHPLINQTAAINVPDELIGNRIVAYVSPIEERKLETGDLLDHCSKFLPNYMIPEVIEISDSLPATSNGKVDRNVLKDKAILKYTN